MICKNIDINMWFAHMIYFLYIIYANHIIYIYIFAYIKISIVGVSWSICHRRVSESRSSLMLETSHLPGCALSAGCPVSNQAVPRGRAGPSRAGVKWWHSSCPACSCRWKHTSPETALGNSVNLPLERDDPWPSLPGAAACFPSSSHTSSSSSYSSSMLWESSALFLALFIEAGISVCLSCL